MRCRVVNLRKAKFDVYIGRAGHGLDGYFGNPYSVKEYGESAIDLFQEYFEDRLSRDPEFRSRVMALSGKTLGCFCKPNACHGDIIVHWVNTHLPKQPTLF
jgi:hypothetical protein